jgi:CubicO group peptidase (beta-lactamase class C family)
MTGQPRTGPAERDPRAVEEPEATGTPQWAKVFEALQRPFGGYAFCVMRAGAVVASGSWGYARMPPDTPDGAGVPFTLDTRCNLASVSKTVTATALFAMVDKGWLPSVNEVFWPVLSPAMPGVRPAGGVDSVTMAELLTMVSRLPEDSTLYIPDGESVLQFLESYLATQAVRPRQEYVYSNTNFTILQQVIDVVAARQGYGGYLEWVQSAVLGPLGIDTEVFSPVPDDATTGTLSYDPARPTAPGHWWPPMQCIGAGGWIGSANTVAAYLSGVSNGGVIPRPLTGFMRQQLFGWYHAGTSDGLAFHHNGDLTHDGSGLSTGVVSFPDGSNAVLLTNAPYAGIIRLIVRAYQTRSSQTE